MGTSDPVHSIFEAIARDHRAIAGLITELEAVGRDDHAERADLFNDLQERLLAHSAAEDQALYALLSWHEPIADVVREGRRDHDRIERLMDEIADLDPEAPEWAIRIEVLRELVTRHVNAEEGRMFELALPLVDAAASSQLADQFATALRALLADDDDDDDDDDGDLEELELTLDEVRWRADAPLLGNG